MPISIKDVADHAGTSRGTVSKVLNNVAGFQISPEKRQRITRAAEELGYQPNQSARALGRGKTDTLGLVVFNLTNPFFADLADTLQRLALSAGYRLIIELTEHIREERIQYGNLSGWPLDGIIVWADAWQTLSEAAGPFRRNCPFVYLGDERLDGKDWVSFDVYAGGRIATEHIIERGYTRPWLVTPFPNDVTGEKEPRTRAYLDVCQQRGIRPHVYVLPREEESRRVGMEAGADIAARPVDERPDALICHNDIIAVGVYHGILRAGLRVPQDMAVMGFDGIDEGRHLDKPLTSIATQTEIMCRTALDIVLRRIGGDVMQETYGLKVPGRLLLGETT